ncbi:MAG: putative toxin-antitoxin system toxin component, PIN family [Nitrospirota bacterium]
MRALFDTNVLISAFLTEGLCSKILLRANKGEFELYTCPFILSEFEENLKTKFSVANTMIKEAVTLIREVSLTVNPTDNNITVKGVCRDIDDDSVLACALAAKVDYIVTGDPDLLAVGTYQGIKIITPRNFELLFSND